MSEYFSGKVAVWMEIPERPTSESITIHKNEGSVFQHHELTCADLLLGYEIILFCNKRDTFYAIGAMHNTGISHIL